MMVLGERHCSYRCKVDLIHKWSLEQRIDGVDATQRGYLRGKHFVIVAQCARCSLFSQSLNRVQPVVHDTSMQVVR